MRLWVMVVGPVSTDGDETSLERDLAAISKAARDVLARGHFPLVPAALAAPLDDAPGGALDSALIEVMTLTLAERCDGVLRVGDASDLADQAVMLIRAMGGQVFWTADALPEL